MMKKILSVALMGFVLGFGVACGDDGGDDDPKGTFQGNLIDFYSKLPLANKTVKALNNTSGAELGIQGTTDANGNITLTGLPEGDVGFIVPGWAAADPDPGAINTYQFNLPANTAAGERETLWSVDLTTYQTVPMLAGITVQPNTVIVAGGFYWTDTDGTEEYVNCGTVKTYAGGTESGEVRYFNDSGLPTTIANRDSINPIIGFYVSANIAPGTVKVEGYDPGGTKVGEATFPGVGGSICISNVYADTATNPGGAPTDCPSN